MPSTFSALYVHVIFSTKDRLPLIQSRWRERLHSHLGAVLKEREVIPIAIGGVADHVHILMRLKAVHAPAVVVRELKAVSSKWIRKERFEPLFGWQEGYGAFSVSPTNVDAVRAYIANQEDHHRKRTAEEEFRDFLKKIGADPEP
ncbi:IS200/IS605 family transposase [Luteolibacter sp. LG18]|uniref:IS200/IS605 family transposase n=1 Tax=Luteolibacter sp. LG18 TaxID=2819286 RepID=UPI002B2F32D7|nr:transposase [Luteolibacter sp. LG18]